MDVVLRLADDYLLDRVWATVWPAVPRSILNTAATLASAAGAGQNGGIFQTSSKSASSSILDSFGNNFTATLANSQTLEHLQNAVYGASEWGSKWQGLSALPRDNFYRSVFLASSFETYPHPLFPLIIPLISLSLLSLSIQLFISLLSPDNAFHSTQSPTWEFSSSTFPSQLLPTISSSTRK